MLLTFSAIYLRSKNPAFYILAHLMHGLFNDLHPLMYKSLNLLLKNMEVLISILFVFLEGYGREYRERLLGQWGVVDVNDCCSCATFLVWLIQTD